MRLPKWVNKNRDTLFIFFILIPITVILSWALVRAEKNTAIDDMQNHVINGSQYLKEGSLIEQYYYQTSKSSVISDVHIHITYDDAQELLSSAIIFYDCNLKKNGCSVPTWRPYMWYVNSWHKTYTLYNSKGEVAVQDNNPATPYLSNNPNRDDIQCTTYESSQGTAYGLCIDPKTGDFWYHAMRNYITGKS